MEPVNRQGQRFGLTLLPLLRLWVLGQAKT